MGPEPTKQLLKKASSLPLGAHRPKSGQPMPSPMAQANKAAPASSRKGGLLQLQAAGRWEVQTVPCPSVC